MAHVSIRSDHQILGVDAEATPEEIRKAFRRRAKEVHPDRGGTVAEFQELCDAQMSLLRRVDAATASRRIADVVSEQREEAVRRQRQSARKRRGLFRRRASN